MKFDGVEVLTFDCYGTLIDWESGIWATLAPILTRHRINITHDQAFELFSALQSRYERGTYYKYRNVLRMVLEGFGASLGFLPTQFESRRFSGSVKDWQVFSDTVGALQVLKSKFKLAIISNVDDELFAFTAPRLQVAFDWVITAQQAKSYKPSLKIFELAFEQIGLPRQKILHVAGGLVSDILPAKALGLSTIWVNRRQKTESFLGSHPAGPDLIVPDLETLAGMVDQI